MAKKPKVWKGKIVKIEGKLCLALENVSEEEARKLQRILNKGKLKVA